MSEDDYRNLFPSVPHIIPKKPAALLLGTDRYIGAASDPEKRVGISPQQARALKGFIEGAGAALTINVIKEAGAGAGYPDEEYLRAGCNILEEGQLRDMGTAPDVFHALKEPSSYESVVPGPFLRIGALHTGSSMEEERQAWSDLARLLDAGQCHAVFDGSMTGGHTMSYNGGFQSPIRQSMSVFAGMIAADMTGGQCEARGTRGRVVIVGGGVAGVNAARQLIGKYRASCNEVLVIEMSGDRCGALRAEMETLAGGAVGVRVLNGKEVRPDDLDGAVGLILAAAGEKPGAPKVVRDVSHLRRMSPNGLVVDVSIDEGGSIEEPAGESVAQAIERLDRGIGYVRDKHLPRRHPGMASEAHGRAVLPYLGVLLYLCAREGGAVEATRHILRASREGCADRENHFAALVCDLAAGLVFASPSTLPANSMLLFSRTVKESRSVMQNLAEVDGPNVFPVEE